MYIQAAKRPRVNTPVSQTATRPAGAPLPVPDEVLLRKRAESQGRLKAAWEGIFAKYERDTSDFADEVDLETGEIVVDKGHLRGLCQTKGVGREGDIWSLGIGEEEYQELEKANKVSNECGKTSANTFVLVYSPNRCEGSANRDELDFTRCTHTGPANCLCEKENTANLPTKASLPKRTQGRRSCPQLPSKAPLPLSPPALYSLAQRADPLVRKTFQSHSPDGGSSRADSAWLQQKSAFPIVSSCEEVHHRNLSKGRTKKKKGNPAKSSQTRETIDTRHLVVRVVNKPTGDSAHQTAHKSPDIVPISGAAKTFPLKSLSKIRSGAKVKQISSCGVLWSSEFRNKSSKRLKNAAAETLDTGGVPCGIFREDLHLFPGFTLSSRTRDTRDGRPLAPPNSPCETTDQPATPPVEIVKGSPRCGTKGYTCRKAVCWACLDAEEDLD